MLSQYIPKTVLIIFLAYIILINIITLFVYGVDKRRAKTRQRRIRESVLLGLAAVGGSIGALLGMLTYNQKTKHKKFTIGVPVILLVQVALLCLAAFLLSR